MSTCMVSTCGGLPEGGSSSTDTDDVTNDGINGVNNIRAVGLDDPEVVLKHRDPSESYV